MSRRLNKTVLSSYSVLCQSGRWCTQGRWQLIPDTGSRDCKRKTPV